MYGPYRDSAWFTTQKVGKEANWYNGTSAIAGTSPRCLQLSVAVKIRKKFLVVGVRFAQFHQLMKLLIASTKVYLLL